jgi:peptide deformylase
MTKDDIISLPHHSLRQRSQKVGLITPEIEKIIQDMQSATISWDESREHEVGVALAAVQVNHLYRIVIIRNDFDNKNDKSFTVFLNPEIVKLEGEIKEDYEGCLSVRDCYGKVPRHTKVRVKWRDLNGTTRTKKVTDPFLARIFQHEIDHTNGVVFVDRIKDQPDAFYRINEKGELLQLNYEDDVRNNLILW